MNRYKVFIKNLNNNGLFVEVVEAEDHDMAAVRANERPDILRKFPSREIMSVQMLNT